MTKQGKRTIVLVLLLAVIAAAFCAWRYYDTTYIQINGNQYSRSIDALDLSGTEGPELDKIMELKSLVQLNLKDTGLTAEEYDTLRFALPKCQISWDVPFQGGYQDCNIQALELSDLTEADMTPSLPGIRLQPSWEPPCSIRSTAGKARGSA